MIIALKPENRESVHPLFTGYPCLRGEVAGLMYGGLGKVFVTDPVAPKAALARLEFTYLAGDPESEAAGPLVRSLQPGDTVVMSSPAWRSVLVDHYPGQRLKTYRREAFLAGDFDVAQLKRFCRRLPEGFHLKQVEAHELARFAHLHPILGYSPDEPPDFIARWFAFGVVYRGQFVCGVESAAIGGGKVEFEVQTHADYRRLGLATATSAAMILHCLESGLEPCWDAANSMSSGLARKLGFQSTGEYDAYFLT